MAEVSGLVVIGFRAELTPHQFDELLFYGAVILITIGAAGLLWMVYR
jgi:hypothetical protein